MSCCDFVGKISLCVMDISVFVNIVTLKAKLKNTKWLYNLRQCFQQSLAVTKAFLTCKNILSNFYYKLRQTLLEKIWDAVCFGIWEINNNFSLANKSCKSNIFAYRVNIPLVFPL